MSNPRPYCAILLAGVVALLAGCGSGEPHGTVTGKVTYKNAPVAGLTIHFVNAEGAFVAGPLDRDGHYRLPGAPLGSVQVYFTQPTGAMASVKTPPKGVQAIDSTAAAPQPTRIPLRYLNKDSARLTYQVKQGGNDIDIELQ
jgi:hypothetical protein